MFRLKYNIAVLSLLLLLAIPLLFALAGIVKQQVLKSTTTERFKTEIIQTISIAKTKLHWAKPGKEVIVEGKYFDVKSFTIEGDLVLLTGFYDHHEDKLLGHLKDIMQQKDGSGYPLNQLTAKYFFFPVFTTQSDIGIAPPWKLSANSFYIFSENIIAAYLPAASPPPEL